MHKLERRSEPGLEHKRVLVRKLEPELADKLGLAHKPERLGRRPEHRWERLHRLERRC